MSLAKLVLFVDGVGYSLAARSRADMFIKKQCILWYLLLIFVLCWTFCRTQGFGRFDFLPNSRFLKGWLKEKDRKILYPTKRCFPH